MWREQFLANFDSEIAPALRNRAKMEGKQMNEDDALIFKRKWEVHFVQNVADDSITTLTARQDSRVRR